MRRLRRSSFVPHALRADGGGGKRAALNEQAWREGRAREINVDTAHWGKAEVRGALHAMQGFVCAYCQRKLDAYSRGVVDHFRPRNGPKEHGHDGYWWLAYRFTNCFLACEACNKPSGKGDKFPLEDATTRAKPVDDASLEAEARLYLDPVADPVDQWMRVEWQDPNREGFIVRHEKNVAENSFIGKRVERSILDFRLNIDKIVLLKKRQRAIRDADKARRAGNQAKIHRLACRYLPHGAVVYQFIREVKPELLPSARDELLIFLAKVKELIDRARDGLHEASEDSQNARQLEELRWTLAFLWKDPPRDSLTADEISAWLDVHVPTEKPDIETKRKTLTS